MKVSTIRSKTQNPRRHRPTKLSGEGSDDNDNALRVAEARVRYPLRKPGRNGQTELVLTPLQFLDRLAALIPPPRRHRHPYHGAFAPHAALRPRVTAHAGRAVPGASMAETPDLSGRQSLAAPAVVTPPSSVLAPPRRRVSSLWARLIARITEPITIRTLRSPRAAR